MKRLIALSTAIASLVTATSAFAVNEITINTTGLPGYQRLGQFISAALRFAFVIALIAVLVMLIWGAIEWIFSGGNKESVANARNRILHALIGLVILAVAFAIVGVFGQFVGVDIFNLPIPSPGDPNRVFPSPTGAAGGL